jgi:uncharacterized protein with HEPN domain
MSGEIESYLKDIIQAINEINDFLPEKKDFFSFQTDLKTNRAIERNIEIIGEAVSRVLKLDPNFPLQDSRKIVDTRNRIIHGYDSVSHEIIWSIVLRDLPALAHEIEELLKK